MTEVSKEQWFLFRREGSGLALCGQAPVTYGPEGNKVMPAANVVDDLDVLAVPAIENPLGDDGLLIEGVEVWINPHRSENPNTYTT